MFLLARSEAEHFPVDATDEIEQERLLDAGSSLPTYPLQRRDCPRSRGELFVVLPTGVLTPMTFAANAPFIQDPARLGIKDPEISPTNRWLLKRIGHFAGHLMNEWLANTSLSATERAQAYDLLPAVAEGIPTHRNERFGFPEGCIRRNDRGASACSDTACRFGEGHGRCFSSGCDYQHLVTRRERGVLDRRIDPLFPRRLLQIIATTWSCVSLFYQVTRDDVLDVLKRKPLPKPESWDALLCLWSYVAEDLRRHWYLATRGDQHIVPVQGKDILYPAKDVVRAREKANFSNLMSTGSFSVLIWLYSIRNWSRFLAERRRLAQDSTQGDAGEVEDAYSLLRALHLDETSDASRVVGQVAAGYFKNSLSRSPSACNWRRLPQS